MAKSVWRRTAPLYVAVLLASCGAFGGSGANTALCPPAVLESVTVDTRTAAIR